MADYTDDTLTVQENPGNIPPIDGGLNLNLTISPAFENAIEAILSGCSNFQRRKVSAQRNTKHDPMFEKMKATNFPASLLKIGPYIKIGEKETDLVCKCYYAKQKLVWEILEGSLKKKIEIHWSNIAGLRATIKESEPGILEIELKQPPLFYLETDPQPRKHTIWRESGDFTGGQASKFRRHYLEFRPGAFDKQCEKLLEYDHRLFELSRQDYPSLSELFFDIPVPAHFDPIANTNGFNGGAPRFNHEVFKPHMKYMCPIVQPQQFHPYKNTVLSAGNVFHHQEMISMESPLEAYNSILSESSAVHQHQDYNNLMMAQSDEIIDNVMVDGSQMASMMQQQMVTMVDPGLLLGSSEEHSVNFITCSTDNNSLLYVSEDAPFNGHQRCLYR